MSLALNKVTEQVIAGPWEPTASPEAIRARAALSQTIRQFFSHRNVLEVETPLLAQAPVTDPYLNAFQIAASAYYLQTSPEYAMKRLLAAGLGSIYQMGKAFRSEEGGALHNPEFTVLEWYRVGFDLSALMDEVDALLQLVLGTPAARRFTYQALFEMHGGIDPHTASLASLRTLVRDAGVELSAAAMETLDRDDYLTLFITHVIEPKIGFDAPWFVYYYPASQAALARLKSEGAVSVAERFEVYVQGVELANGYYELTDADVQQARFRQDCAQRARLGLSQVPVDDRLVQALAAGVPDCSGVALGVDRLLMLQQGAKHIDEVLAFPWRCA